MKTNVTMVCKITWTKNDPLGMASIGDNSVAKMTGNGDVPNPPTPMDDVSKACQRVRNAFPDRLGDDLQRQEAVDADTALDEILHEQVVYVDSRAKGDKKIIIGCGFEATSDTRTKAVITEEVKSVKLTPKVGGSVKVLTEIPVGSKGLFFVVFTGAVYTLTVVEKMIVIPPGASGIQLVPRGKGAMTLKGFSAFSSISIVVYSINAAGISAVSNVFTTQILK